MAYHDDLTKLPNRRYIKEKLKQDMLKCKSFALLIIDIDRFKRINEALGHAFWRLNSPNCCESLEGICPIPCVCGPI